MNEIQFAAIQRLHKWQRCLWLARLTQAANMPAAEQVGADVGLLPAIWLVGTCLRQVAFAEQHLEKLSIDPQHRALVEATLDPVVGDQRAEHGVAWDEYWSATLAYQWSLGLTPGSIPVSVLRRQMNAQNAAYEHLWRLRPDWLWSALGEVSHEQPDR